MTFAVGTRHDTDSLSYCENAVRSGRSRPAYLSGFARTHGCARYADMLFGEVHQEFTIFRRLRIASLNFILLTLCLRIAISRATTRFCRLIGEGTMRHERKGGVSLLGRNSAFERRKPASVVKKESAWNGARKKFRKSWTKVNNRD